MLAWLFPHRIIVGWKLRKTVSVSGRYWLGDEIDLADDDAGRKMIYL